MVEGKILVVEDEHIVAMGIRAMLSNLGYTVTGVVSTGEEAIIKAESNLPDLVLMDIMLKGNLDGIEASKEIISRFGIPVVYLTACSDHKVLERIWDTGSGYITKPFDEKDLKKGIDSVLMQHRLEKRNVKRNPGKPREDSERLRTPSSFLPGSDGPM
ncbi:response regulator [Methanosarcina sp. MSH10X1]|uniref:response regulator n=1 Tax=Methanosarcina sp. MSH10X1 TaxID=2507075 RepID=UPI000FFB312D|nr:response regulator [Methanosarcina sp. MSH10X1]RXA17590.1 response regulator [Methanosarcina sp. MSH10X1]